MSLDLGDLKVDMSNVSQYELDSLGIGDLKIHAIDSTKPSSSVNKQEKKEENQEPIILEKELGYIPSLVICVPGETFSDVFLKTWTNTVSVLVTKNVKFVLSSAYSDVRHFAKTLCLGGNVTEGKNQKPFANKIDYTHLLWIDPRIVHNVNQIISLLLRKVDVVAGVYSAYQENKIMAIKNINDKDYFKTNGKFNFLNFSDIENKHDLIEVDYCGMGFMLMSRKAVESVQYPWFYSKPVNIVDDIWDVYSDDIQYCLNLRENGFKVYIDPNIRVGKEIIAIV